MKNGVHTHAALRKLLRRIRAIEFFEEGFLAKHAVYEEECARRTESQFRAYIQGDDGPCVKERIFNRD